VRRLQAHRPNGCSIYDRAFSRHERYWKVCADTYIQLFNGTAVKNLIWRLLGVRIGRRVFDDGCVLTERTFVTIGDRCTLNAGSVIQCHSQEDGAFKSDRSALGAGCTLGVGAFVHYGVTIGDGAMLAADSFLMKGEQVPAHARWGGNPAQELPDAGRVVLRSTLPGPTPDMRLVSPSSPSRRPLALRRPSVITLAAVAALGVLVGAPQVLTKAWAALRDHVGAAIAALSNADAAAAASETAQVLALLSPVLGVAVLAAVLRRPGRPRPTAAAIREPAASAVAAGAPAGSPPPSLRGFLGAAVPVILVGLLAVAGLDQRVPTADEAARTATVVVGLAGCLLLFPVARRLRLSATGAALAVVLCGLPGVATGLVGSVDPGAPAALSLTVGALLAGRSRFGTILAAGAAVIAALAAPLAAVGPLALVAHGMLTGVFVVGRRTAGRLLGVTSLAAAVVVALRATDPWSTLWSTVSGVGVSTVPGAAVVGILTAGAFVLALSWLCTPDLRPVASAAAALLACAAVPGPHRTTALLLAVPVLAVLAAAVVDELPFRASRPRCAAPVDPSRLACRSTPTRVPIHPDSRVG
jgi:acetyltransferase-like isoleucine patch superfamily enzyme